MLGSLQYHRLEDNIPLQVSLYILYPMQLIAQGPDKLSSCLPTWRIIATGGHDREVMPPPLPHAVVRDAPVEAIASVGVHPVSVDLHDSEVFRGWGVTRQISLFPLPVL